MITTKQVLHKYKNGNCRVTLYNDGTKIRVCTEKVPSPVFPESIDFKITNYCDRGCKFCHESCTTKGKHANRKTHVPCRRCGTNAFNIRKGICASCGYGKTTTIRTYNWAKTH